MKLFFWKLIKLAVQSSEIWLQSNSLIFTENTFIGYVSSSIGLTDSSGFLEKLASTFLEKHEQLNLVDMMQLVKESFSVSFQNKVKEVSFKTVSHFSLSSNLGYTKQLSKTSLIGIVELTRVERTTCLPEVCNANLTKNKFDSKSQFGLGIVVKITLNSFSKSHFSFLT